MRTQKTRVAVLGGGMGGLSAAYELTRPEHEGRFEVTVYQMGWRLGGKGASSRSRAHLWRIEEHGLHLWMGCYENAFRVMRDCYGALGRAPGTPLATWRDAFAPRTMTVLQEQGAHGWTPWPQEFPELPSLPGENGDIAGPLEMIWGLVRWAVDALPEGQGNLRHTPSAAAAQAPGPIDTSALPAALAKLVAPVEAAMRDFWHAHEPRVVRAVSAVLRRALDALRWGARRFFADKLDDDDARRTFITVDYALANSVGVLEDELALGPEGRIATYGQWLDNLARIDDLDYRAWLRQHGAHPVTVASCIVRGLGDAVFNSGLDGAAGAALNGLYRLNLTYRGSVFWQMQAGMGETVFTPMYEVLRARGVRFEFFHRVERLRLDGWRRRVVAVDMVRQAKLRNGPYEPLEDVPHPKGILPCWPEAPLWDQLEDGDALAGSGADLESPSPGPHDEAFTLRDFDEVVLGIPVGALGPVTAELARARPAWKSMLERLATTPTQSVQLWFDRSVEALGWPYGVATATAYEDPLDTWAEMSHLLEAEDFGDAAKQCTYLVGSLQAEVGEDATARVRAESEAWMNAHLGHLTPGAMGADGKLAFERLAADPGLEGVARLDAQYFRANTKPSDLYVLTVPGSTRYRLRPHRSGFDNLVLAGDWTKTGLNVGSIEAATMSGLRAAQGITGVSAGIVGDYED